MLLLIIISFYGISSKGMKNMTNFVVIIKKKDDKWFHFTGFDKNRLQNNIAEYDQS